MKICKFIETEEEYEEIMERINEIFFSEPGSPEAKELDLLMMVAGKYEQEHHAIGLPDPVEAIKTRMQEMQISSQSELAKRLGVTDSQVSMVMNRRRDPSIKMVRLLHQHLGIPHEVLLKEKGARLSENTFKRIEQSIEEENFRRARQTTARITKMYDEAWKKASSMTQKMDARSENASKCPKDLFAFFGTPVKSTN